MNKVRFFAVLLVLVFLLVPQIVAQEDDMIEMPESIQFLMDSFYGDFEGYEDYIHPEWEWYGNGTLQFSEHEGFVNALTFWTTAFPNLEYEVLHLIGEGDDWALGVRLTGTNSGGFEPMGIVANDNALDFYGYGFCYLEDDMIRLCDWTWDWVAWYEALGIPYGQATEETTE